MESLHIPVMLNETIAALAIKPGGRYIDGTLGRAGHTREMLKLGAEVLGIDRDDEAIAAGEKVSVEFGGRLHAVKGRHGDMAAIAERIGWSSVEGVLLDLGVSSPQLDVGERGFSFLREGPLDMRMDRADAVDAASIVNGSEASELERIFREYGEEPQAKRIAREICREVGERGKFETTRQLADFIERQLGRRNGKHPATRVFQALRMAVNDEVGELEKALASALELLAPGGRLAVITFESITDRIVKRYFAEHIGKEESLIQGGSRWVGKLPKVRAIARHAVIAGEEEISKNPRSRSAKLRAIEKE